VATSGEGIDGLIEKIAAFRARPASDERRRHEQRTAHRIRELIVEGFMRHLDQRVVSPDVMAAIVERVSERKVDPYTAAHELLQQALAAAARAQS
jgi:putative protein kinase ArgK-like GTPase of G3E family